MYGCGKDCLILIPFRLPQISCLTLSLNCFSSDSDNRPDVGIRPLIQFPHLLRAGPVLLTLLFFPQFLHPTEFCLVLYILFWWSGTPISSQPVFCKHFYPTSLPSCSPSSLLWIPFLIMVSYLSHIDNYLPNSCKY